MSLDKALDRFEAAINAFDVEIGLYAASNPDAGEAAVLLERFERIRKESIKIIQQNMFSMVSNLMVLGESIPVNGLLVVKSKPEDKKKWQHEALADKVLDRMKNLHTDEDGEINLSPKQAIKGIMDVAHIDYWRVKDLAKLDINPDLYVDLEEQEETVTIRKP